MESSCSWSTSSVVRGHHVYKKCLDPLHWRMTTATLYADRIMNDYDDHAVSVMKAETIVGHVPREISRTFWHFMHGGSVRCEITGRRTLGKGGGGGGINEGGRIHDTNSFYVEKYGGGGADKRWGAL